MPDGAFGDTLFKRVDNYLETPARRFRAQGMLYFKALLVIAFYTWAYYLFLFESGSFGELVLHAMMLGVGHVLIPINVAHDAIHGAFSPNRLVNALGLWTMAVAGADPIMYRTKHLESHANFEEGTAYTAIETQQLLIKKNEERSVHPILYLFYAFYMIFVRDFVLYRNVQSGVTPFQWLRLIIAKGLYATAILFLPFLIVALPWWQIAVGIVSIYVVIAVLLIIILLMPTTVMESNRGATSSVPSEAWILETMRNYVDFSPGNRLLNAVSGGSNLNVVHHLFPQISHMHYVGIGRILKQTAKEFDVPYAEQSVVRVLGIHLNYILNVHKPDEGSQTVDTLS